MKTKRAINTFLHGLFNVGFATFFWGAFEQAIGNALFNSLWVNSVDEMSSPVWSNTFGYPIPHHYIIGAAIAYSAYALILLSGYLTTRQKHET